MPFEVFQKGSAPIPTVPSLTIQKRGLLSLNRAALKLMGDPVAVELLWDADRQVIGLRPVALESPNAYPVRPQSAGSDRGPVLVAGNLFTRFIGIDTSEARRWVPSLEGDILCVDISSPGQRVTSNRSRRTGDVSPSPSSSSDSQD